MAAAAAAAATREWRRRQRRHPWETGGGDERERERRVGLSISSFVSMTCGDRLSGAQRVLTRADVA